MGKQAAARRFRQMYTSAYGASGPEFMETPLMEALELAAAEHKMVMVYLHSELNQDSDAFCRYLPPSCCRLPAPCFPASLLCFSASLLPCSHGCVRTAVAALPLIHSP